MLSEFTISRKFHYVLLPLVFVALVVFTSIPFNSFFWADDFWFRVDIKEIGFWKNLSNLYFGWDGRAFSLPYVLRNFFVLAFSAELTAWIATIAFLGLGFFYSMSLVKAVINKDRIDLLTGLIITVSFSVALWVCMRPHLSRSLYWPTGTFYTLCNFMSAYWMYSLLKNTEGKVKPALLSLLTLSCGMNLAGGLLTLFALAYLLELIKMKKSEFVIKFAFMGLGTAICTLAPGNFGRAAGGIDLSIGSMLLGYKDVFIEYILMTKGGLMGALAMASLFIILFSKNIVLEKRQLVKWSFVYFAASLATIVPFTVLPSAASKHTAIFFQSFMLIGLTFLFVYLYVITSFSFKQLFAFSIVCLFLIFFGFIGYDQYRKGRMVKRQITERYALLESRRGDKATVNVPFIIMPDNFYTNRLWDISADSSSWENVALSKYFGVGFVKAK